MDERILDHVGIAVSSLDEAIPVWERLLEATATDREVVDSQQVEIVFIGSGSSRVELLAPLRPNSPVAQFLEKRGAGIHHVAFRVENLHAALERLRSEGYVLVDDSPRQGAHGRRIAFVHPHSVSGALVELVEGSA